tara:strand:- start:30 stop:617 length:588 start_codon:yes stop_codon:yes gene_type:complete
MLKSPLKSNVEKEDAEEAVRTLIKWIGDDPEREGLIDTPKRVIKSFQEHFAGYFQDPEEILLKTFEQTEGYDDMVILKTIDFESHCEHHMLPIIGQASIAYFPNKRIVGISKLARIVNLYAKRLQTQEVMTSQIINSIEKYLKPLGSAILIEADHHCMKTRGVHKKDTSMSTIQFRGCFENDKSLQDRFLNMLKN